MKKTGLYIIVLLLFACSNDFLPPPKKLLSENEMESIIYDLALLNAMSSSYKSMLKERGVVPIQIIYKWYNIDSLTYAENDTYYASKPEAYSRIYKNVLDKMNLEKKDLDSLVRIELQKKEKEVKETSVKKDSTARDTFKKLPYSRKPPKRPSRN